MYKVKLPPVVKAFTLFALILFCLWGLYRKGLIDDHLRIFNPGCRLSYVAQCERGLELSHVHLLAYRENTTPNYCPIENFGDDMGIYYFVTLIQNIFHLSNTYMAYLVVFVSIVLLGYSLAIIGTSLLFENNQVKFFSYFYLALIAFISLFILDVYILAYLVTSLIPLLYWVWKKHTQKTLKFLYPILALFITGLLAGIANQFRVYSGMGIIIIVFLFILLEKNVSLLHKLVFICALLASLPLSQLFFNTQINQRDAWIASHDNTAPASKIHQHTTWHNIYLGLGILPNKYGITWEDGNAYAKEKQFNPGNENYTPEYINAIKNDYFTIVKNDLPFVLKTFAYKAFLVLLLCIVFFNYGIFLILKTRKNFRI